jgi:hypothetical protein
MRSELHRCAKSGNLKRIKELVEGGANIDINDHVGVTPLMLASLHGEFEIVEYLVEHGANVAHTDSRQGMAALHCASIADNLSSVKYLLEHGASITQRSDDGTTGLLSAAECGSLAVIEYLLSPEGGASIRETDGEGNSALLLAAGDCCPPLIQWLLEYGGAKINHTNNDGTSVWDGRYYGLPHMLQSAYKKGGDGEYVAIDGEYVPAGNIGTLTAMLRVMVLHGSPPDFLTATLPPPFQRIVQDGARLRARLPAYLAQRRALSDVHCPLLPPIRDLVHGYEEPTTTDELWATGLGAPLQRARRSRPERGQSPERRSARLRQKRQ